MEKKYFSIAGTAYFLLATITMVVSYGMAFVLGQIAPGIYYFSLFTWIVSLGPMYLIGMPVCKKVMDRLPKVRLYRRKLTFGKWFSVLCICFFVMYLGNILGNFVTAILGKVTSLSMEFDLQNLLMSQKPGCVLLFSVIIAPILEELFFRKILIDRMIVFGDKAAIFLSGFFFGLFHGNFYQVFYAFGLGCVLAYVYIRTGNIKYTISLHMAINFFGGFISTWLLRGMDFNTLISEEFLNDTDAVMFYVMNHMGALVGYALYVIFTIVLGIMGLVFLIMSLKHLRFYPGEYSVPCRKMAGYMFGNVGMWLFIGSCIGMFVMDMV